MMRQAALQWVRSKKTPKPKPFLVANINTNNNIPISKPTNFMPKPSPSNGHVSVRKLWPQTHTHNFCTTVSSPKEFTVTRAEPELVAPAKPTPRELKPLSFVDNWATLRYLCPTVRVYRYNDSMQGIDPARVILDALARALVFYYPLAGRVREGPDGRLFVDCTGEGIVLVEADADFEIVQLGDPPFSCIDELTCDVPSFGGITDSHHLIYIQVTRMKCGGFILGVNYNHAISDAGGIGQFLNAVGEIARGAHSPSITPVWCRDIFDFPDSHHQEKKLEPTPIVTSPNTRESSLFFGPSTLFAIRMLVPDHLRPHCTTFEILTAYLWRCKVAASQLDPDHVVCLYVTCSGRNNNNVIPKGYYGNSIQPGMIETSASELCESPMEYAIELVKKAKEDGFKKLTDPPEVRTHAQFPPGKSYLVISDTRKLGTRASDFGWGEPAFAGTGKVSMEMAAHYLPYTNRDGEDGVLVMFCWPSEIGERVEYEVTNNLVQGS